MNRNGSIWSNVDESGDKWLKLNGWATQNVVTLQM